MPADRDLSHLYPPFRQKVERLLAMLARYADKHMAGCRWIVVEGLRTAAYQRALYRKGRNEPGRVVTFRDGYRKRSTHQFGLAVDVAPANGARIAWDANLRHWSHLGHCARKLSLDWGGDWPKVRDMPHVEWPEDDGGTYRAAERWVREQGLIG